MAKRFKTRFVVITEPDGKLSLSWDWPPITHTACRGATFVGPAPVELPKLKMTQEEFDAWTWNLCTTGYQRVYGSEPLDAPSVQELPDHEAASEFADISTSIEVREDTVAITITNRSAVQLPMLRLDWRYQNEVPQRTDETDMTSHEIGGAFTAFAPENLASFDHDLLPHATKSFVLRPDALPTIRGHIASLSPERYYVAICSWDHEFSRIDGCEISDAIDQLEE